jgi:uncharacterized protein (TIGR02594 family)
MTLFDLAQRFVGELQESPAATEANPFIQWGYGLCGLATTADDAVAWCSTWLNSLCWLLRMPRSKSAAARSWLLVGQAIGLEQAVPGSDVVVLMRGTGKQPGPDVIRAAGHVGLFAGLEGAHVLVLGGNQSNGVSVARFPVSRVLGVRRLATA